MQDIFPNEVGQWQGRGAKIIDVREPAEYAGGHLPGAVNIPLAELTLRAELSAAPVVVVCASGGRSARAPLSWKTPDIKRSPTCSEAPSAGWQRIARSSYPMLMTSTDPGGLA